MPNLAFLGLNLSPNSTFRGLDGNIPSPVFGWVALVVALLLCVMVGYIRRGGIGQRMLAVRSNERASAAAAVNPRNVKLIAFGISSFIAGVAGTLYAYNSGSVSPDRFDAFTALSLIAFAYAGGITLISGAVFAGLISTQALFPYALDKWFGLNGNYFLLFGGVILIITLLQNPEGVMGALYKRTHRKAQIVPPEGAGAPAAARRARPRPPRDAARPVLATEGVSVDFGGVHALRNVSFEVGRGRAGRPDRSQRGRQDDLRRRRHRLRAPRAARPARRARPRAACPRTRARGSDSRAPGRAASSSTTCSSRRTSRSPRSARRPGGSRSAPHRPARDRRDARPLRPRLGREGQPRPTSRRVTASWSASRARWPPSPRLLMLDEPAAGLDTAESEALGAHLRAVADGGQSTLLIDHDMGLVLEHLRPRRRARVRRGDRRRARPRRSAATRA